MKLGLFAGRHEMPVDGYAFGAEETALYGYHQDLYNEAVNRGRWTGEEHSQVDFYITGLTIAAIGVLDGLRQSGCRVTLMNYDSGRHEYVPVEIVPVIADAASLWYGA
jgi:hypothetical protein